MQEIHVRMGLVLVLSIVLGAGAVGAAEDSSELGPPPGTLEPGTLESGTLESGTLESGADEPAPPVPETPAAPEDARAEDPAPDDPAPGDAAEDAPADTPPEEGAPEGGAPEELGEATPAEDAAAPADNGYPAPEPCEPCPPPACCPSPREPLPCLPSGYDDDGTIRRAYAQRKQQSLGHLVMGSWRLTLEAAGTLLDSPEGTLGEPVPAGTPAYSWDEHDYDIELGGRVGLRIAVLNTAQIEIRGFWLGAFEDSSRQSGAFGFSPPPGGVSPVSPASLESEAELWGGDAMWWQQIRCGTCSRWAAGIGARLIRFDEVARYGGSTTFPGAAPASVKAEAENQFFGIQAGLLYEHDFSSRTRLEVSARGFWGSRRTEIDVSDVNMLSGGPHSASRGDTDNTWGFDLGITGTYQLSRNVALTASYGLLFLADIQRAHDAMDFSQAGTGVVQARSDTDDLIAHSFFLGIQLDL